MIFKRYVKRRVRRNQNPGSGGVPKTNIPNAESIVPIQRGALQRRKLKRPAESAPEHSRLPDDPEEDDRYAVDDGVEMRPEGHAEREADGNQRTSFLPGVTHRDRAQREVRCQSAKRESLGYPPAATTVLQTRKHSANRGTGREWSPTKHADDLAFRLVITTKRVRVAQSVISALKKI